MSENKDKSLFSMITFFIGLLFGGLATLLFSTDENGKTKKDIQKTVAKAKDVILDVTDKERVREIFGKASDKAKELYTEAKGRLNDKVAELKEEFEEVDKKKYQDAVAEVVEGLKNEGNITANQIKKLKNYFVADFTRVTSGKEVKKVKAKK